MTATAAFPAETVEVEDFRLQSLASRWWVTRRNGWRCCNAGHLTPEAASSCVTRRAIRILPAPLTVRFDIALAEELCREDVTMAEVAAAVGVSRERIRQLVDAGRLPRPPKWLEASTEKVRALVEAGLVEPTVRGRVLLADYARAREELRARACEWTGCDQPIDHSSVTARFCAAHRREAARYRYPILTPEQRRAAGAATRRWQAKFAAKSPGKARARHRRYSLVWQLVARGVDREEARRVALAQYPEPTA